MPGTPNILDLVHRCCAEVAALHSEHVRIDDAAVARVAGELRAAAGDVRGAVRGLPLPIKFTSLEQELSLLALYHLLDFGFGYDALLRRQSGGRDARETLQYGILGLHLGGARLDHHKLKSFSMYDIYQVFGIEATTEVEVMPGVTMAKPGPLQPLCKLMLAALHEAAAALADSGHRTLGELLLATAAELKQAGRTSASAFVEELVEALPPFRDAVLYDGRTLTLHRKAQNLAGDLALLYGSRDERFAFPDVDRLAADSGPTTIAVLRAKGVLVPSADLAATLDAGEELPAGPHERALRAAAVAACDKIVAAAAAGTAATAAAASEVASTAGGEGEAVEAKGAAVEEEGLRSAAGEEGAAAAVEEGGAGAPAAATGGEGVEGAARQGGGGSSSGGKAREGSSGEGEVFRAIDVGAYLSYLAEEGRELHGKVKKHVTTGLMAY